jgi:EAL domain-containing protein (putative c-di-GMP-specific phosphodiesterase class I)/GGDEF domain-containing protein
VQTQEPAFAPRLPDVAPVALDLAQELDRILSESATSTHFQPIMAADSQTILGWEALTRGPSDSPLHSPVVLFDIAARMGRLVELERMLMRKIIGRFKELGLPGQLFLNVTADAMASSLGQHQQITDELHSFGMPPSRIVVELTETRAAADPQVLDQAIASLRSHGFIMAIDDLGEGFASLKRWSQMRPDFVKIDRHFIDGLHRDPVKQQFVRSIVEMAQRAGCTVIGEGVEEEADLQSLIQQGVNVIQGYLLARPAPQPRPDIKTSVAQLLADYSGPGLAQYSLHAHYSQATTAGALCKRGCTVTPALSCQDVVRMFNADVQLMALPVLDAENRVMGVLRSLQTLRRGTDPSFQEQFGKQSCTEVMDAQPLVFEVGTSLRAMSEAVASLNDQQLVDGFIVTDHGKYFGTGRMTDLIKAVSDMQVYSARYANPLTQLPGNVPIEEHVQSRLDRKQTFVVAYFDLDHFKAFNDVYGYSAGDAVIQLAARALADVVDAQYDFLGHIGGDDFIMVLGSEAWESQVQAALKAFDAGVPHFYSPEHLAAGGVVTLSRQGVEMFHPIISLSAGVARVRPGSAQTAAQLSTRLAETKRQAKQAEGSSYFVDRR